MEKVWSLSSSSSNNLNFYSKYLSFKSEACWWKKNSFGNIDKKIRETEETISKLQYDLEVSYSEDTHKKIFELEKTLNKIMHQRKIYWKQ